MYRMVYWLIPLLCAAAPAFSIAATQPKTNATSSVVFTSGFEAPVGDTGQLPESWELFTSKIPSIGTDPSQRRSGLQCAKFEAQKVKDAHAGLFVKFPVDPRKKYIFGAHVMNAPLSPLARGTTGKIGIEWHDRNGREIHRQASDEWDAKLSRNRWEFYQIKTDPPPTAADAHFVIYISDGEKGDGAFLVDDVLIEER